MLADKLILKQLCSAIAAHSSSEKMPKEDNDIVPFASSAKAHLKSIKQQPQPLIL
jgi:hypothetical protein